MSRRVRDTVLIVFMALQIFVAPAVFALDIGHSTDVSTHHTDVNQDNQDCPCCPDRMVESSCLSFCSTAFAIGFTLTLPPSIPESTAPIPRNHPFPFPQTYAPPNPPPIR